MSLCSLAMLSPNCQPFLDTSFGSQACIAATFGSDTCEFSLKGYEVNILALKGRDVIGAMVCLAGTGEDTTDHLLAWLPG